MTVYHISGAISSGDSRLEPDRNGVSFRNQLEVPWNTPESIVTLDSPGGRVGHHGRPGCHRFPGM